LRGGAARSICIQVHFGRNCVYDVAESMEGPMLAKAVSVIAAGVLTVITLRRAFTMMKSLQQAKVRAEAPRPPATRLRQDPNTGVYYPES
jgi:hypothetical protein